MRRVPRAVVRLDNGLRVAGTVVRLDNGLRVAGTMVRLDNRLRVAGTVVRLDNGPRVVRAVGGIHHHHRGGIGAMVGLMVGSIAMSSLSPAISEIVFIAVWGQVRRRAMAVIVSGGQHAAGCQQNQGKAKGSQKSSVHGISPEGRLVPSVFAWALHSSAHAT